MIRRILLALASMAAIAAGGSSSAAEPTLDLGNLKADAYTLEVREGYHHFEGNIQFRYPGMLDLDCDDLKIRLQPGGRQIERLIASNHVVLTILQLPTTNAPTPLKSVSTNRIYAAVATYVGTNDVVTLVGSPEFGQPWVERSDGSFKADAIVYDRGNDRLSARGNFQMIFTPSALPKDSKLVPSSKPSN